LLCFGVKGFVMNKKPIRLKRAKQTRARIATQGVVRLAVHRSNSHIYASVISGDGDKVLTSVSTLESEVKQLLAASSNSGSNVAAATLVGKKIAEKALSLGINSVAFDRSGFRYHGRVKAVAEAARSAGLQL
jgi:large subunit ribosomal protein L18